MSSVLPFFARRSRARGRLVAVVGAAGAMTLASSAANAAELLDCTGTEYDLRAELIADVPLNGLNASPGAPGAAAGPLDDGTVEVTAGLVSQVFPAGIPFIDNYDVIFANVNGTLTFEGPLSQFTPDAIPGLAQPTIAPFFGDVDLRPVVDYPGAFTMCIEPANARVFFTWRTVGYYTQNLDLLNSFQVVLTNNDALVCPSDGNFEVEFRYEQLQWTTGDASGGVDGLGGNEATAGIDAGDMINAVALPGSGEPEVLDLVTETNVDDPGVFRFLVAEGTLPECGDGGLDLCEQCDDGNDDNNDACTNLCLTAVCGDELIRAGVEACDGTQIGAATCPAGYTGTPLCNNDPANPAGNGTCTFDAVPDGCVDDDECTLGTDDCDVNATCANTPGSFTCTCNPGWEGSGVVCTDIDECAAGTDDCDVNATCLDIDGGFTCTCNAGFEGNGVICTPIGGEGGGGGGVGGAGGAGGGEGGAGVGGQGGAGVGGQGGAGVGGQGGAGQGGAGGGEGGAGGEGGGVAQGGGGSGQGTGGEGAGGPGSTGTGTTSTGTGTTTSGVGGSDDGTGGGDGDGLGVTASGNGCNCTVAGEPSGSTERPIGAALFGLAAVVAWRRRRRA